MSKPSSEMIKAAWEKHTTWGLTHRQFLTLSFSTGDHPSDVVYVSPKGCEMTRHMCDEWLNGYNSFSAGFVAGFTAAMNDSTAAA